MSLANNLALNGGAVHGTMAIHQLIELHEVMGGRFMRHWDYIGGTSTGALILALLVLGYTPKEILAIYEVEIPKIFSCGFLRQARGLSKYNNTHLIEAVYRLIGDIKLKDLKQKVVIPTVNVTLEKTKIFKSYDIKDGEFKLADVVIASASAPTYFPAYQIGEYWYNDGGLSSNNPSDILLKECQARDENDKPLYDKVNILSITTGHKFDTIKKAEKKGNLLSVPSLISNMLHLQDEKTHGNVFTDYKNKTVKGCYIRCESVIKNCSGESDDSSKSNMLNLMLDGKLSVLQNKNKLKEFHLNTLV